MEKAELEGIRSEKGVASKSQVKKLEKRIHEQKDPGK